MIYHGALLPIQSLQSTSDLHSRDATVAAKACARLQAEAGAEDESRLLAMLQHPDFFIREAAAWPLAELAGPRVIRDLLLSYQRGFDEGHDNDGFTAALLEIPALHSETRGVLEEIFTNADGTFRENVLWLLQFCEAK